MTHCDSTQYKYSTQHNTLDDDEILQLTEWLSITVHMVPCMSIRVSSDLDNISGRISQISSLSSPKSGGLPEAILPRSEDLPVWYRIDSRICVTDGLSDHTFREGHIRVEPRQGDALISSLVTVLPLHAQRYFCRLRARAVANHNNIT